MCGGVPLEIDYLKIVAEQVHEHGAALHIDGARIFNAALALGVPASEIGRHGDSVQFCLSKGLGAPVGSIIASTAAKIESARRIRKMLGGGMRQAGILAAAGLVALETADERLQRDHENARMFSELLDDVDGVEMLGRPKTNIVYFQVLDSTRHDEFLAHCARSGLAIAELGARRVRAVFHHGVNATDVRTAARIVRLCVEQLSESATASVRTA
jgi:threonine aldolase